MLGIVILDIFKDDSLYSYRLYEVGVIISTCVIRSLTLRDPRDPLAQDQSIWIQVCLENLYPLPSQEDLNMYFSPMVTGEWMKWPRQLSITPSFAKSKMVSGQWQFPNMNTASEDWVLTYLPGQSLGKITDVGSEGSRTYLLTFLHPRMIPTAFSQGRIPFFCRSAGSPHPSVAVQQRPPSPPLGATSPIKS